MNSTRRNTIILAGAAFAAPFLSRAAWAQAWPSKPIKAVVPISAGSTIDIVSRIVFDALSHELGQTVVVENRAGAGGTIGSAVVARAEPDGYTLLANSSQHAVSAVAYHNVSYDTARDFSAVAAMGSSPNITVVSPAKGFKALPDLVAAAKAKPGGLNYGSAGVGSATHLSAERFRYSAGFDGVHVPFRGMPETLTEVMTGRVDFCCSSIAPALPLIREGKLTALAVTTPKRSSALPDVPTSTELGYRDSDYTFWTALFLPAKTPRDIVDRLHQATQKALNAPGVQDKLKQQGMDPMPIEPAAFDAHIKAEIEAITALVKAANIKFG